MRKIQKFESNLPNDEIFTSKANVLISLQKQITKSKIEQMFYFTVLDWNQNHTAILQDIKKIFNGSKHVIVRSSAKGEDSPNKSYAGTYESILNVSPQSSDSIQNAVESVITSYVNKGNKNLENQILIQNQASDIITSGVVFTRTPDIAAPYFVINFEEGGSTTDTTHGMSNNMIKIFRLINRSKLEKKWQLLLVAINEVESILKTDLLDIEFGITKKGQIIIFQVRPLTSIKEHTKPNLDSKISKLIHVNQKKYSRLIKPVKHVAGKTTIFSDMADWNPSEIIGDNPNLLDYSLYDYLIMKDAWHKGRTAIMYQNVHPYNLMVKFANKPYVDVRGSFNSLIPLNINKNLKKKLMRYYLNKLSDNPFLHDKVEFDILFTCYDLTTKIRLKELNKYKFSKDEIKEIKKSLLDYTNYIIKFFEPIMQECENSSSKLDKNRDKILSEYSSTKKNYFSKLLTVELLLNDCREHGTIQFSTMARIAFVATALLNSLVKSNYMDQNFVNNIMYSICSPLSEFRDDLMNCLDKEISLELFLKKYGHLRPGTYDITAPRYDKKRSYFDLKFTKPHISQITKIENSEVVDILQKHAIYSEIDFLNFIKKSIAKREYLKFSFTHNLSDAIELIAEAGNELGFSRKEIAYLDLKSILTQFKKLNRNKLQKFWQKKIAANKRKKDINSYIILPPIINSINDFEIIQYYSAKPNFITEESVSAEIINQNDLNNGIELENKIILLESADPGYDWIFTRNLVGLITKYGGIASHMSIRCAELGLPAAIGCGEIIFEKLMLSARVLLDCKNKEVVILEHKKHDEYVEERKILKSLGYIK